MDINKPWGWRPNKGGVPAGAAPLSASAAEMPGSIVLPEDPDTAAARQVGVAVADKAVKNWMATPAAATAEEVAQAGAADIAGGLDPALAPLSAEALAGGAPVVDAATGAADMAANAASVSTDALSTAASAAGSGLSNVLPFAGAAAALAQGEYGQAAANALGNAFFGPAGGAILQQGAKWLGAADGTTSVQAPLGLADGTMGVPSVPGQGGKGGSSAGVPASTVKRAEAGARFAPELFGSVPAQGGKAGALPNGVASPAAPPAPAPVASPTFTRTPLTATAPVVSPLAATKAHMDQWQQDYQGGY
jgi:hypothetical protein